MGRTARSDRKLPKGAKKWRGYYRDADGGQHAKMFATLDEAKTWERENLEAIRKGSWTHPQAGKVTLGAYTEEWFKQQVWRDSTEGRVRSILDVHVLPTFKDKELAEIRPSHVQAWVKGLKKKDGKTPIVASYTDAIYGLLASIMVSAVQDRMINVSPCSKRINLPTVEKPRIRPLRTDQVEAIKDSFPEAYRALVMLSAGTGMRQGECLGLTVDRVDFMRREIHIDRQMLSSSPGGPSHGPPKTPASNRVIPLPETVGLALSAHIAEHGTGKCACCGDELLFFHQENRGAVRRQRVNEMWDAAIVKAKVVDATFHDLRHYCASLLIAAGVSVVGVQEMLGHASAVETLNTYSHLWPTDHDRIRQAIDGALLVLPTLLPNTAD